MFFVASAAAAELLGFRACLKCRPETAPGSPAWRGTATTVLRGLRLIDDGFLDGHTVAHLAARLGVGARHLERLFVRHFGVPPTRVAIARRTQAARRLVTDTERPVTDIALMAGFRSVRRFNDAFRKRYRRTPSSLRGRRPASREPA